jgi:rsbT co-antagonist protein RsbR
MNAISNVATYLVKNAETIAKEIIEHTVSNLEFKIPIEQLQQAIVTHTEFIKFLGDTLTNQDNKKVGESLIVWNKKYIVEQASSLGELASYIKPYADNRLFLINRITEITMGHGLSTEEVVRINNRVHYLLDTSIAETVIAYEHFKNKIITEAQEEVNELSAPIVPVRAGVAVLPLIGTIDTNRAKFVLEKVVPRISQLGIHCLIIDFSGIVVIDTAVANHIFKIHHVLRLLGIKVVVSGIRPELAQTVVHGGIDFSSIQTYATVQQALSMK